MHLNFYEVDREGKRQTQTDLRDRGEKKGNGRRRLGELSDMDMNQNGTFNSTMFTKTKLFSGKTLVKCMCFKRLVDEQGRQSLPMNTSRRCAFFKRVG